MRIGVRVGRDMFFQGDPSYVWTPDSGLREIPLEVAQGDAVTPLEGGSLALGHLELDGYDAEKRAASSIKDKEGLSYEEWATKRLQPYYSHVEMLFSPDLFVTGGGVSKDPYVKFAFKGGKKGDDLKDRVVDLAHEVLAGWDQVADQESMASFRISMVRARDSAVADCQQAARRMKALPLFR